MIRQTNYVSENNFERCLRKITRVHWTYLFAYTWFQTLRASNSRNVS